MTRNNVYVHDNKEILVKRQNRKSLALRIAPSGEIVLLIPYWVKPSHPQVKRFIRQSLQELDTHLPETPPAQLHTAKSVRKLVDDWSVRTGFTPKKVQMRTMYRKWGSCSSRGNITLNTALYYLPFHLVEYIVVHELVHLEIFDHGPAFWSKLGEHLPDCAERERELNAYHV
jgi:predicted metal-dependent hydrolase